ncbi:hypothetical protein BGZ58_010570 [Dissophora ornata]|nr:hypothetical protein BGZ58_010570 [Dissophora ornata]
MAGPEPPRRSSQKGDYKQELDEETSIPFAYEDTYSNSSRYPQNPAYANANNNINLTTMNNHHRSNSNNNYNNTNYNHNDTQAEATLRLQLQQDNQHHQDQYRVPRVSPAPLTVPPESHELGDNSKPKAPPSYFYPPQPLSQFASADDGEPRTLAWRIQRLFHFPCSTYGKALMLTIGIEALLVIIMQAVIVSFYFQSLVATPLPPPSSGPNMGISTSPYLDPRNQSRSIPAYLIVFVFALLFQVVFAWDAVRAQNTIELIGIVLFNFCCFAYSIFEISQIQNALLDSESNGFFATMDTAMDLQDSVKPFLIVVVCIIGIGQCLVSWLGYQLFREFGWKIYKKIGADPNMKKMYRAYQIYLVLIKVDLFFFVGFSIQFIYLTLIKRAADPEYWITIAVLPITVVLLYVAVYAVRHESRKWMATFLVAMLCGVVYFIFKVIRMYVGSKADNYIGVKKFLTLFASLCLITILLTIANAAICFRNFGKGLKPHLMREGRESQKTATSLPERTIVID